METTVDLTPEDVRSARALVQWSQSDLARAAGVEVSTIADFENGLRTPISNNLTAIRSAFETIGVRFMSAGPSIFSEQSLLIMTEKGGITEMRFRYAIAAAATVQEVVSVFGTPNGGDVDIDVVQTTSPELRSAIDSLVTSYGATVPQLNKLKQIIGALADGEKFLLLPAHPGTTAEKLALERYLHCQNNPNTADTDEGVDDLFGTLLERYDFSSPRTDRHTVIGAGLKPRRCRFCSRTAQDGATFRKIAHVIPTALGNDHLKSAEECDECNEYFGCETEPSLIAMLDIQRVFLGTQGRGKNDGRPKLHFGEAVLTHDGSRVNVQAHSIDKDDAGTLTIQLGKGPPLTPLSVYRALVKIVLSVLPSEVLPRLNETIQWTRYGAHANRPIPKVHSSIAYLPNNPSAQITVYIRREPHPRLPHIIGEFRLGCYIYVFAVPFSDLDRWDLLGFFEDADFRETFRHYAEVDQWVAQDFSRATKVTLSPQIKLVRNQPPQQQTS